MAEHQALLAAAKQASERAWAPYSRFHVGVALETDYGGVFTGCNVENASYGLTMCAERVAIGNAIVAEGKDMRIKTIALWATENVTPCGACRQVIAEFAMPDTRVVLPSGREMLWQSLLPEAFAFKRMGH